jgi:hypothetical protein
MCVDKLVGATLVGAQDPCAAIKCNDKANVCIAVAGRAACVPKPSQGDDTLPTLPPVVVCPPQTTYQASTDGTVQCVPTDDTVQLTCASMRCMQGCCRVGRDGLPFCAACVSSPTDGLVATVRERESLHAVLSHVCTTTVSFSLACTRKSSRSRRFSHVH